jgi:hypothetical protein
MVTFVRNFATFGGEAGTEVAPVTPEGRPVALPDFEGGLELWLELPAVGLPAAEVWCLVD